MLTRWIQADTASMIASSVSLRPGHTERVIAPRHLVERRTRQRRHDRRDLGRGPERIARALHEQHRRGDRGQVRVAALLRLARRVQRIAEEDQAGHARISLRADV